MLYVAELTGRTPAIENLTYQTGIEQVFDLQVDRYTELCPYREIHESRSLMYENNIEQQIYEVPDNMTIMMRGFFQSWKYTRSIDRRLRRHLVFRREIRDFADRFLADNTPSPKWMGGYTRVGVHVRRGDVLTPDKVNFGYTTPNETYFQEAMKFYADLYGPRIQFIVVSNDMDWCKKYFPLIEVQLVGNSSTNNTERSGLLVNLTYSVGHSAGEELALLASCDHVIMSTGTYGWWAAWLAKGMTVYYADWPRNGSNLAGHFSKRDFFPPNWIGMT